MKVKGCLFVMFVFHLALPASASQRCQEIFLGKSVFPMEYDPMQTHRRAWVDLRNRGLLVTDEMLFGPAFSIAGLGPFKCALNMLQAARATNLEKPLVLMGTLLNTSAQDYLRIPRKSIREILDWMRGLFSKHFPGETRIEASMMRYLVEGEGSSSDINVLRQWSSDLIRPKRAKLKMLVAGVVNREGTIIRHHFYAVEDAKGNEFWLGDPDSPSKSVRAELGGDVNVNGVRVETLNLIEPNPEMAGLSLVPVGVFTINIPLVPLAPSGWVEMSYSD